MHFVGLVNGRGLVFKVLFEIRRCVQDPWNDWWTLFGVLSVGVIVLVPVGKDVLPLVSDAVACELLLTLPCDTPPH